MPTRNKYIAGTDSAALGLGDIVVRRDALQARARAEAFLVAGPRRTQRDGGAAEATDRPTCPDARPLTLAA